MLSGWNLRTDRGPKRNSVSFSGFLLTRSDTCWIPRIDSVPVTKPQLEVRPLNTVSSLSTRDLYPNTLQSSAILAVTSLSAASVTPTTSVRYGPGGTSLRTALYRRRISLRVIPVSPVASACHRRRNCGSYSITHVLMPDPSENPLGVVITNQGISTSPSCRVIVAERVPRGPSSLADAPAASTPNATALSPTRRCSFSVSKNSK